MAKKKKTPETLKLYVAVEGDPHLLTEDDIEYQINCRAEEGSLCTTEEDAVEKLESLLDEESFGEPGDTQIAVFEVSFKPIAVHSEKKRVRTVL